MAFPQGIDFRATAGFVTDPASCTNEVTAGTFDYPTTTPQGNTVGWENNLGIGGVGTRNRSASVDPRIAGLALFSNSPNDPHSAIFRVDLPAPGAYPINIAAGDASFAGTCANLELIDGATSLGAIVSNGSYGAGQWFDATGVLRTSSADWVANNAALTKAFSTTIARIKLGTDSSVASTSVISHLFIGSAGGSTPTTIALAQASWGWSKQAPAVQQQLSLAQKQWSWQSNAPTLNFTIALIQKAWGWATRAPAVTFFMPLARKAWAWAPNAPAFVGSATIALGQAAWGWSARGVTLIGGGLKRILSLMLTGVGN